jgi:hypothetical protein
MHFANIPGGNMISRKTILMTAVLVCTLTLVSAGTGTDALNFLNIKPSARGASIGDGFVAVADDANAVFYNPAGLTQLNDMEFSLMHMSYIAETSYEYAAFAMPAGENFRLGAYVSYLNYGSIGKTTEDSLGNYKAATESYTPNDLAVALSGALKLSNYLSAGLTVKYASESIDTLNITGIMVDAGILADLDGVKAGASIYNIGATSIDKAPMGIRAGCSTKFNAMTENDLTGAAGINYSLAAAKLSASIGGEWKYENFLFLRGSYGLNNDADALNVGLGVRQDLGGFVGEVAYNFSLFGDLGAAHRISVGIKLGDADADGNYKKKKANSAKTITSPNTSSNRSTLKYYFKKK